MAKPDLSHAIWRKSSYSNGQGECVEVAVIRRSSYVRDSKAPMSPALAVGAPEWHALISCIKAGQFDL